MNMIVEMVRKNNQTLIVVTHEPELAVYGDKVIHIKDGHIERMEINENPIRKMEIEKPEEQQ